MSTVALTRAKPEKKPSRPIGRPRKYKFDKYRDRPEEASSELDFPGTMKEALERMERRVEQWAKYYHCTHPHARLKFSELVHFGKIGVVEGYARYDPSRGVKFNTFCDSWIRSTIRKNLHIECDMVVKASTKEYYHAVKKGVDVFENGDDPSKLSKRSREIYDKIASGKKTLEGCKEELYETGRIIETASEVEPLDVPVFGDGGHTRKDNIVCTDDQEPDRDYERLREQVNSHAYSLIYSGKVFRNEETMINARYVFEHRCFKDCCDEKETTFEEMSGILDVSKQYLSQLNIKLMETLLPKLRSDPHIREAASNYFEID